MPINLKSTKEDTGKRLDIFVTEKLDDLSRSSVRKLFDTSKIFINGVAEPPSRKIKSHEKVLVYYSKEESEIVPKIDLPIIYEDGYCLVIDKPVGILSHSKGRFLSEPTVESFISDKIKGFAGDRAGIVHRLDRATSGVIICAKTPEAYTFLQKQFSTRKVKKTYVAVVMGHLKTDQAIIDMPIQRNPKAPSTFRVNANGKSAETAYKVIKSSLHYSLLELEPKTGRTHQLRVHLSHMGHPIVGDIIYKGKPSSRLYLHAQKLEIKLPDNHIHTFEVPMPQAFNELINDDNG